MTPLRLAHFVLFSGLGVITLTHRAFAFCFAPQLRVSDEYFISSLVVTGTVLRSNDLVDPDDKESITGTLYRVRIDHRYRDQLGNVDRVVTVYSENSTARFPMEELSRYILFLDYGADDQLTVDNCGNSGLLHKGDQILRQLRSLPLQQSFVYGSVYPFSGPMVCSSMLLTLHGPSTVKTQVHSNCSFYVKVVPGNYSAQLRWKDELVASYDLPYKDPYCFTVPKGGSAGLAFRPLNGADDLNRRSVNHTDELERNFCAQGSQNKPRMQ